MSSLKPRFPENHPISTLWESMRLETRSRSPWTGWSSASWGSTRYSQSTSAWRASANWPENKRASSNLCCLRRKISQIIFFTSFYIQSYPKWVIPLSHLSTLFPHTVSHLSRTSPNKLSNFCVSAGSVALSLMAFPERTVVSYTGCLEPRDFWNSCSTVINR